MWWILQIGAILIISALHMFNRWCGIHPQSMPFVSQWFINIGGQGMAAPMFMKSYALAPTFFQPWFLGTSAIAILGFVGSLIFFGEAVSILKILGAVLGLLGAVLLIL